MSTSDPYGFAGMSNDEFVSLASRGFNGSGHIEAYLLEGVRRGTDPEVLGDAFDQFIEECLIEVGRRYTDLFTLLGFDSGIDPHQSFLLDSTRWLRNGQGFAKQKPVNPGQEASLDWPWPITEPGEPTGEPGPYHWYAEQRSGLWICGYRVGGNGLPPLDRTRLLNYFFRNPLPSVVQKHCGDEYGEPGSEQRLRRMAHCIARNCRTFKRRDRERYSEAIDNWERDLAYLKRAYYHAGTFPWPPVDGPEDVAD